jgi:hypothetical protein
MNFWTAAVQKSPWPLSLLALKSTIHHLSLDRKQVSGWFSFRSVCCRISDPH